MAAIEAILACIGVVALAALGMALANRREEPTSDVPLAEADVAAPYREGLHAAVRMQRVAQDLEQQIYAEAAQHLDDERVRTSSPSPEQ